MENRRLARTVLLLGLLSLPGCLVVTCGSATPVTREMQQRHPGAEGASDSARASRDW